MPWHGFGLEKEKHMLMSVLVLGADFCVENAETGVQKNAKKNLEVFLCCQISAFREWYVRITIENLVAWICMKESRFRACTMGVDDPIGRANV